MGKQARLKADKSRKIAKRLRNTPEAYIDLVDYVQLRTRCSRRIAEQVLLAGALKVDSHPVGFKWRKDQKELDPFLPAKFRDKIVVQMPKELKDRD